MGQCPDRLGSQPSRRPEVEARLELQRRAPANFRWHASQAATRLGVLLVGDFFAFTAAKALLVFVAAHSAFAASALVTAHAGYLDGWELIGSVFIGLLVTGTYNHGDSRRDVPRLFLGCALGAALPLWSTLWSGGPLAILPEYTLVLGAITLLLALERTLVDRVVSTVRRSGKHARSTILVGPRVECRRAMSMPAFAVHDEFRLLGMVTREPGLHADTLGTINDLHAILGQTAAEAVVVCGDLSREEFSLAVEASAAAGCHLLALPRAAETFALQPNLVWRYRQPLIELVAPSLKGWQFVVKRTLDLIGATVALVFGAPLMALITLAIRLDSSGPVLFRQTRIGTGGRHFQFLKFRTMRHGVSDATHRAYVEDLLRGHGKPERDARGEQVFKLVNDDRITRVGRWLRKTSLDELPQLLNVLRGDMSLVGPRPPLPYECDAYDHWQFERLGVRPGLTGLWQVSGRNRLSYLQMCELDVEYVRRWSLWLDLKILFRTVPVVLFNSGRAA